MEHRTETKKCEHEAENLSAGCMTERQVFRIVCDNCKTVLDPDTSYCTKTAAWLEARLRGWIPHYSRRVLLARCPKCAQQCKDCSEPSQVDGGSA